MESKFLAEKEKLIIDSGSSINFIDTGKIILCQQDNESVIFQMIDQNPINLKISLNDLTKLLEESTFIRINDEFLINLKYLEHIPEPKSNYIELAHNLKVPVTKSCKKEIMEALDDMGDL